MLECQERTVELVMITTAVRDSMMATTNLLFLILFFQHSTFLEERENENTAMTIHRSSYNLFRVEEYIFDPLA